MRRVPTALLFAHAALAIASCGSDGVGPCATEGAVRVHGLCECPEGTYHDPKVDECRSIPGYEPSDAARGEAGASSDAAVTSSDAETMTGDSGAPPDDATAAPSSDADSSKTNDAAVDVSPTAPEGDASSEPSGPQQGPDKPTSDASTPMVIDASMPATDASAAPDASPLEPVKPPANGCVAREEVCNGKDDDCDGMIDEGVLPYWYRDCDGDDYAANATGRVESCTRPPATAQCKGWTKRVPEGMASLDCDDTTALRFPGATFGIAAPKSGDLNCDGKVELRYEVQYADPPDAPGARDGKFKVCASFEECDCYQAIQRFRGYKGGGLHSSSAIADEAIPLWTNPDVLGQPCALANGEALHLTWNAASVMPSDPADCHSGERPTYVGDPPYLIVRDLCR